MSLVSCKTLTSSSLQSLTLMSSLLLFESPGPRESKLLVRLRFQGRKRPNVPVTWKLTPQKQAKLSSDVLWHGSERGDRDFRSVALYATHLWDLRKSFSLSDICRTILDKSVAETPNQIHPKVIREMCQLSIQSICLRALLRWPTCIVTICLLAKDPSWGLIESIATKDCDKAFKARHPKQGIQSKAKHREQLSRRRITIIAITKTYLEKVGVGKGCWLSCHPGELEYLWLMRLFIL